MINLVTKSGDGCKNLWSTVLVHLNGLGCLIIDFQIPFDGSFQLPVTPYPPFSTDWSSDMECGSHIAILLIFRTCKNQTFPKSQCDTIALRFLAHLCSDGRGNWTSNKHAILPSLPASKQEAGIFNGFVTHDI